MTDAIYWIWFANRVSYSNVFGRKLLLKFGNAKAIYDLSDADIVRLNIPDNNLCDRLCDKNLDKETEIINTCAQKGYNIFPYNHKNYPARLRNIPDFPYVLYHRGNIYNFEDSLAIAIVGTRKSSGYGDEIAYKLGRELSSKGALIVSGMALGIDAMAHKGAISVKRPIVAVLGSGIDVIQPASNRSIYEYILYNGAVFSEYPPGTPGYASHFPVRNRIISGLSVGVVVVEAEKRSGSLITANYALEQGKDLFAVPNIISSPKGAGTNNLIKEGAYIVTSADDILDEYKDLYIIEENANNVESSNNPEADLLIETVENLTPMEKEILCSLKNEALTTDAISEKTGLPIEKVVSSMTLLEIKGAVVIAPGNKFALNIERNG